jgi:hypothetical protein
MKYVLGIAVTLAALFGAGLAHADDAQDEQFIQELADRGYIAREGVSQIDFEAAQINAAHLVCLRLGQGRSRSDVLAEATGDMPGPTVRKSMALVIDAAVDVYCPSMRGQR